MTDKTIDSFIKELQRISEDKRKLPLVITCPNTLQVSPEIKKQYKDGSWSKVEKMVITW